MLYIKQRQKLISCIIYKVKRRVGCRIQRTVIIKHRFKVEIKHLLSVLVNRVVPSDLGEVIRLWRVLGATGGLVPGVEASVGVLPRAAFLPRLAPALRSRWSVPTLSLLCASPQQRSTEDEEYNDEER